jgi:hypothetical protein
MKEIVVSKEAETTSMGSGRRLGLAAVLLLTVTLGLGLVGTQQAGAATTDVGAASPSLAFRTILLRPPRSSVPALGSGRAARLSASSDGVVTSASGTGHLTIVPNFDDTSWDSAAGCEPVSSSSDAASLEAAFNYAAGQIEAEYSDPITVDLGVCVDPGDGCRANRTNSCPMGRPAMGTRTPRSARRCWPTRRRLTR